MKFPVNKQSKGQNNRGNTNGIRKDVHKASLQAKGPKNSRNIVQQQRANNALPSQKLKSKGRNVNEKPIEDEQQAYRGLEEDDGNLDAYKNIGVRKGKGKKTAENEQYNSLLESSAKGFKRQKNMYFLENEKYKGQQRDEDEEEQEKYASDDAEENDMQDEESQEQAYIQEEEQADQDSQAEQRDNNEIKQALSMLKEKRQNTSKLINTQLQSINAEDETQLKAIIKNKSKTTEQEYAEAIQLKKQLEVYDKLVELRYGQQKELQEVKKYPKIDEEQEVPKYPPMSHELFTASRELENEMITNLSKYLNVYKTLAKKTICGKKSNLQKDSDEENEINGENHDDSTNIDLEGLVQADNGDNNNEEDTLSPGRLNVDRLYDFIKESISSQNAQVQKELIKWSQKTSFLTPSSSSQLNSLLMQTPVGQAKKVMQNWERLANKCQQKRGRQMFKILFESEDNIHEMSDPQIYDDYDLFIELEKYYLERLQDDNEDGEFLQSATMKYLKNKQANQLEHEKKQKDVDRKASKNRKIRYNVHTKLLNFMPACPENVIQTRDQIVRNMFNCNATANQEGMEGNVSKYRAAQHHDETELIDVE